MKRILILFLALNTIMAAANAWSADFTDAWAEADSLVEQGLLREADQTLLKILTQAQQAADQEQWAKALVERMRLQTALGAPETAVRDLRAAPWPTESVWRGVVELFYAQALVNYQQRYSHEIRTREKVAATDSLDLKAWTHDRFSREVNGALQQVWARRNDWGNESLGLWSPFLDQNNYPARIRGTLRDAVSYLWVEHLANTALWLPGQLDESQDLDVDLLLSGPSLLVTAADLADPQVLPLLRISWILRDLRQWHLAHHQPEAALETELEQLRRLHQAISFRPKRLALRHYLETRLADFDPSYPWWSRGQWQLAAFIRSENEPDSRVRAHLAAAKGRDRHPTSIGGRLCANTLADLEHPRFYLTATSHDAARKRSIQIKHKNINRLYLRAWPVDLPALVGRPSGTHFRPGEVDSLIQETPAAHEWTVDLPETEDYEEHLTYTGLPDCRHGAYLVVASRRADFDPDSTHLRAVLITISDLVITTQQVGDKLEVLTRHAGSGEPWGRVRLTAFASARRRSKDLRQLQVVSTDRGGRAELGPTDDRRIFRILARKGNDLALLDHTRLRQPRVERAVTSSFVYTDRAIYRPGQTVHWKVVGYQGNPQRTEFQTLANEELTVRLIDTNGQEAGQVSLTTNDFGSASGSFVIPAGGLLGGWRVRDSLGGTAVIRVEQYKRPTFAVRLLDPETPLQLNLPAVLVGQADYLFGQPVTSGSVTWHVRRTASSRNPWWSLPRHDNKTIASGTGSLDGHGRFPVEFQADADRRLAVDDPVIYRYEVVADVTSEGGETRSIRRTFSLGQVAIQASITAEVGFVTGNRPTTFTVRRTDLNQIPRAGAGHWALHTLVQPAKTLLPADSPRVWAAGRKPLIQTPGDRLAPRWQSGRGNLGDLRQWPLGSRVAGGSLQHGDDGLATIRLDQVPAGAYRLVYTTVDRNGRTSEARHEFIATGRAPLHLNLPLVLEPERGRVAVGDTARFLLHSGLTDQPLYVQVFVGGHRTRAGFLRSGQEPNVLKVPVAAAARLGLQVTVSGVRDHQHLTASRSILVPWDNMLLDVSFATFRDRLTPGQTETFTMTIKSRDGSAVNNETTELLAYMYDRSLDAIASQRTPLVRGVFGSARGEPRLKTSLSAGTSIWRSFGSPGLPLQRVVLWPDRLRLTLRRGVGARRGDLHVRGGRSGDTIMGIDRAVSAALAAEGTPLLQAFDVEGAEYMVEIKSALANHSVEGALARKAGVGPGTASRPPVELRQNFSETAFWLPHVRISGDGTAVVTFKVPDSATDWNVRLHALTRDLHSGQAQRTTASVKDLMVRPYLPRFLREGDTARLQVVVNNAGTVALHGQVELQILDPDSGADLSSRFGLTAGDVPFAVAAGAEETLVFALRTPAGVGSVLVKAVARAGSLSDGEQRPLPILPGRMHLIESRFVALNGADRREMKFPLMASDNDATRVQGQLVVTIDAQLFGSVLSALPYLVQYPHECVEQTLNRYLSTSILAGVYAEHPAVQAMAESLANRETRTESWRDDDPNRRLLLEESPWLQIAGGGGSDVPLLNMLDPETVTTQRKTALAKLAELQDSSGGFPWFPGGLPAPHMTLTVLMGLARGAEFGVQAPDDMVARAWRYLYEYYQSVNRLRPSARDRGTASLTLLNYLLSSYQSDVWQAAGFTSEDRADMLDASFAHWRTHSRLVRGYLALTLQRAGREADARLVFAAVMDAALTDPDLGTYWAPEDRAWLWYNDTVEAHAFALRVLTEIAPADPRRQGLAQWLLLNKKLGHWKSTRATAEAIYALVHYMVQDKLLATSEVIEVACGPHAERFEFQPDVYGGAHNQIVYEGDQIEPQSMATVVVAKTTPGLAFASATWHFSTEQLPEAADGDLFGITRRFFRREHDGTQWVLHPLAGGDSVAVGDQIEVQLSLTVRQAAEYVHLRDPRGAGFEPQGTTSGYHWQNGLGYYEEVRDSGTNFFFDRLPTGQFTLKYRLRATMAGQFKVGPATMQSLYAPEFAAHSAGRTLAVAP